MKVTFLGTGTSHGVPMIGCTCPTCESDDPHDRRLRPSLYIQTPRTSVLVDAGPDLRQQALAHRIRRVDAILFTHGHADHILGIDDVRQFNAMQRGAMPCYGDEQTLDDVRRMFAYVFDPATPKGGGLPHLELFTIGGAFCLGDLEVQPVPLFHGRRAILGFRFGRFAYLTDCSRIPEDARPLLRDLEVLVVDALRIRPHPTHFSLDEAIEAAREIGARHAFFTHMCHDLKHADTCAGLPDRMTLAHDGLVLDLPD